MSEYTARQVEWLIECMKAKARRMYGSELWTSERGGASNNRKQKADSGTCSTGGCE